VTKIGPRGIGRRIGRNSAFAAYTLGGYRLVCRRRRGDAGVKEFRVGSPGYPLDEAWLRTIGTAMFEHGGFDRAARARQGAPRARLPGDLHRCGACEGGRHLSAYQLGMRLRRHGIPARVGRNTALMDLASQLPAAVSELLGIGIKRATDWSVLAGNTHHGYADELARRSH
jgi:hypothetical protein